MSCFTSLSVILTACRGRRGSDSERICARRESGRGYFTRGGLEPHLREPIEVPSADFLLGLEYFRGTSILRSVPGGEVQVREVVVLLAPVSAEDTHPSRPILLSSPPYAAMCC